MVNPTYLDNLIRLAFQEDIGDGDHTSLSTIPPDATGKARLLVKEPGILAGVEVAERVFQLFDPSLLLTIYLKDGAQIKKGDVAFEVEGKVLSILQCERLVLNFMQRLSGIATQTREYAARLEGLKTKVLDTRKTTPGLRLLEKWAVKLGGGENHRIGLYDMILIKDNHIDFSGGITQAVQSARAYLNAAGKGMKIEVEARNLADVEEILAIGGVDRIMLDNFNLENTRKAVKRIAGAAETESSGGITLETLRDFAECGVDYISVGALTHQIKSLDLSLKAVDF